VKVTCFSLCLVQNRILGQETEAFSNWEPEICMMTLSPGIVSKLFIGECARELTGLESLESEISHLCSTKSGDL